MNFALLSSIPLLIGGVIYIMRSRHIKSDFDYVIDMNVQILTRIQQEMEISCTLLFDLRALDPQLKELVITDVRCKQLNVEKNDFEKIIFYQMDAEQSFPSRSIGLQVHHTLSEWSARRDVKLQIYGYVRGHDNSLQQFRLEKVAITKRMDDILTLA